MIYRLGRDLWAMGYAHYLPTRVWFGAIADGASRQRTPQVLVIFYLRSLQFYIIRPLPPSDAFHVPAEIRPSCCLLTRVIFWYF